MNKDKIITFIYLLLYFLIHFSYSSIFFYFSAFYLVFYLFFRCIFLTSYRVPFPLSILRYRQTRTSSCTAHFPFSTNFFSYPSILFVYLRFRTGTIFFVCPARLYHCLVFPLFFPTQGVFTLAL